eukprot:gb/GECG01006728.1/.p1 GENE.gb/GECG01006728.1/~~gb/GECG01006728.1/.p1  ORF type:complete len:119 (+),score=3.88 gb/GECG01006728.1/:1-357(+)
MPFWKGIYHLSIQLPKLKCNGKMLRSKSYEMRTWCGWVVMGRHPDPASVMLCSCSVETRTLEIERREDLRKRATDCVHELHQRLGDLQSSSEIYRTGQYCEELLRDTISMIFDDSGNS